MFDSVLVANRGEIACRVMRTAKAMGLRTIAVHSDADAGAAHVALADQAVRLGPAPAADSYLVIDRVLAAARQTGAQAIHPGYGFLSENAAFAAACADAGIAFVGPPAAAIRAMGGKSQAKALMAQAGVPLVPGYHGDDQDPDLLLREAGRIGFPVLIKASAGGGGKGMRVVAAPDQFTEALAGAKREAAGSFGDDRVLIEKYLARPRHVEIQIFADTLGNAVYLFERDCSLQRRHQKVVEEAPAPGLDPRLRARMGSAAVAAATAIGYVGAGTVEFLLAPDGAFYFMEMNTRLQVEHPVTELITGQDLVEWQLRVAAGEPLPCGQDDLAIDGHAVEVRLYAEDPEAGFLPATGRLDHLVFPAEGPHVRVDTGVRAGDAITIHYDPMIAKLIVWDRDRPAALRRLRAALAETQIVGLANNTGFLAAIAAHPAFAAADLDTRFLERHGGDLLAPAHPNTAADWALAGLAVLADRRRRAAAAARASAEPDSPWGLADGWRLNDEAAEVLMLADADGEVSLGVVHRRHGGYRLTAPDGTVCLGEAWFDPDEPTGLTAVLDGVRHRVAAVRHGTDWTLFGTGGPLRVTLIDTAQAAGREEGATGRLTAPMPGRIVDVLVAVDDVVGRSTPLVVLEAMKMEHTVRAPADGVVTAVPVTIGDQVEEGAELVVVRTGEGEPA